VIEKALTPLLPELRAHCRYALPVNDDSRGIPLGGSSNAGCGELGTGTKGQVHGPLASLRCFFVLRGVLAFNRLSAFNFFLESRFEMLVFVTRCNTGAMSRCVSIPMQNLPVRPGIQRGTKIQGCFSFSYLPARRSISSITFNNGLMIGFVKPKIFDR